jgi:putative ABC transport system ATP-binding protein
MDALLSVREVSKIYRNGATGVTAVNRASLEVRSGEVILILGPSGSGKTTLLSIMGCLLHPTHGEVFVGGQNVNELSDGELSRLRREQIGFVFQSFNLLGFLTVRKNVEVALNLAGVRGRQARERAMEVLCQVGLEHRLDFLPKKLSGGEKQRVSIARALANNPKVILADEPTGNLDSTAGRTVVDLMAKLARQRGGGVVIVTHDNRILDVADRVLHLSDGSLVDEAVQRPA